MVAVSIITDSDGDLPRALYMLSKSLKLRIWNELAT